MRINKKQIACNCSDRTGSIKYIVIHDTGNTGKGADAESHYRYFNGGDRGSSADFFVDDTKILQVNDYTSYYTWHCGDGHGRYGITNNNSIGIEICINSDGDYSKAFENAVALTKRLMAELGIDINHVVRHYDTSRKNCPQSMSGNDWTQWREFKRQLTEMEGLTMGQYEELKREIQAVKPMVYDYMDDNMPSWAKPTIQKLMDKGILQGDDKGRLGLTMDAIRIFVANDRAGLYD